MKLNQNILRTVSFVAVFPWILGFAGAGRALAVDPEIHAAWAGDIGPVLNRDYFVTTAPPASPEFPNVKLRTGTLTWQIWSTDTDNPDGIGDIGVILCPYADNFGVRMEDHDENPGARHVKGIILDPTNASNHSRLTGGKISGNLTEGLVLQESTGGRAEPYPLPSRATCSVT